MSEFLQSPAGLAAMVFGAIFGLIGLVAAGNKFYHFLKWQVQGYPNEALIEAALLRHARSARDEVTHLTDEFLALARTTSVPTPAIERLYPYLDPETPLMPEGRAEIPLRWDGLWIAVAALVAGAILVGLLLRRRKEEA